MVTGKRYLKKQTEEIKRAAKLVTYFMTLQKCKQCANMSSNIKGPVCFSLGLYYTTIYILLVCKVNIKVYC